MLSEIIHNKERVCFRVLNSVLLYAERCSVYHQGIIKLAAGLIAMYLKIRIRQFWYQIDSTWQQLNDLSNEWHDAGRHYSVRSLC